MAAAASAQALRRGAAATRVGAAALGAASPLAARYAERAWGAERTLVAVGAREAGDVLYTVPRLPQFVRAEPDMHTLQVGQAEHLDFAQALPAASLTHHECDPNGNLMCAHTHPVSSALSLVWSLSRGSLHCLMPARSDRVCMSGSARTNCGSCGTVENVAFSSDRVSDPQRGRRWRDVRGAAAHRRR